MASNKFDNHIKGQLEQRTIPPSNTAWQTLEHQLNSSQKRTKKPWVLWSSIAAGFTGVLLVISALTVKQPSYHTVNQNTVNKKTDQPNKIINESLETTVVLGKTNNVTKQSNVSKHQFISNKKSNKNNQRVSNYITETIKKEQRLETETITSNNEKLNTTAKTILKNELQIETERLLAEALAKTHLEDLTQTIDAESLLSEIEIEVEQSFRIKLFEAIKNNISELKTVIVDRNK